MEMDGLYDRTTKSDVMKSTFTAVLWFYDDEKLEERRREILEEIRRNMTPGQRVRFSAAAPARSAGSRTGVPSSSVTRCLLRPLLL
jgi:hypothetical protein